MADKNSIHFLGKPSQIRIALLTALLLSAAASEGSDDVQTACGHGDVKIRWPHPGLVQPLLLASDGVRVSISNLQSGKTYHSYLQVVQNTAIQLYKEFVWTEGYESIFEVNTLPDGPLELRLQVFGSDGCLEGSATVSSILRRNMGLENPACPACFFTTGWASAHFANWEAFFFDDQLPPLPSPIDILEIGSWEGMSAIWLHRRLGARTITCVDTWRGGADQGGSFAESVLPGLEERFEGNMRAAGLVVGGDVIKEKGPSAEVLPRLAAAGRRFDVVYVDGGHTSHDAMLDGVLGVRMLRPGGRLLFDDYRYFGGLTEAIDAFHRAHAAFLDRIDCGHEQACFVLSEPVLPAQPAL